MVMDNNPLNNLRMGSEIAIAKTEAVMTMKIEEEEVVTEDVEETEEEEVNLLDFCDILQRRFDQIVKDGFCN
jgi:hypothetical protein